MTKSGERSKQGRGGGPSDPIRPLAGWLLLSGGSLVLGTAFKLAHVPAGLFLGPMIVAVVLALRGHALTVPHAAFVAGQAVIGMVIASTITRALFAQVAERPLLFAGPTMATLAGSALIAVALVRGRWLPRDVAIWGATPGAALTIIMMARDAGADWRLVAVMSYVRVILVVVAAAGLAAMLGGTRATPAIATEWTLVPDPVSLAWLAAVGAIGAFAGIRLRIPGGAMIGPLVLAVIVQAVVPVAHVIPGWLLVLSYAVVGWRIGLSFTAELVRAAYRARYTILVSSLALIVLCVALAWGLTLVAPLSFMTAFLAIAPGGMDSIAIIANEVEVDFAFVSALQVVRFVAVIAAAPMIARWARV